VEIEREAIFKSDDENEVEGVVFSERLKGINIHTSKQRPC